MSYWENFKKYRHLLKELVIKDIKLKYRRSYLGLLWTLLNPILMMIVLTIVFSTLFKNRIENFPVYLLSARTLFDFYSQATKDGMGCLIGSGSLIKKVYVPKYIFPLAKMLSAFVNMIFSLIALIIVMIVTKVPFAPELVLSPFPLIYVLVFTIGMGLILSTLCVFFRDIVHLYSVLLTAWMYFTPLFYPEEIIPDNFKIVLQLNPLRHMINMFRNIVLYHQVPTATEHLICIGFAVSALLIGLFVFYKKQDKFILYI